jgi:hypothetical protein
MIVGGPLKKGFLTREDYNTYFLIGVHRPLRQVLENRIMQAHPYRRDEDQYTVSEVNDAAEWYFRRNKYESMMVRAAEWSDEADEDYSGDELENSSSDSGEFDSDYEEFRRKKKQHAKKKKLYKKKKAGTKKILEGKETQGFQGNEDEIASLIRKLNAMRLDDPEYAPIYYKVMVMDRSGTAEKCVKPPITERRELSRIGPPAGRVVPGNVENGPVNPATFPNNIPLGGLGRR